MTAYTAQFRGVYLDDATSDSNTVWTYREDGGGDQRPKIAARPTAFTERIDPYTGQIKLGSIDLTLHRDTGEAETFEGSRSESDAEVASPIAPGDTEIDLGGNPIPGGRVVHVGWESIQLGSYDSNSETYKNCNRDVRGFPATQARAHEVSAPVFNDNNGGTPYMRNRIVRIDPPQTSTPWYGRVTELEARGPRLIIKLDSYYSALIQAGAGSNDRRISEAEHSWFYTRGRDGNVELDGIGYVDSDDYELRVRKENDGQKRRTPAVQIGEALFTGMVGGFDRLPIAGSEIDEGLDSDVNKRVTQPGYEVLITGSQFEDLAENPLNRSPNSVYSHPIEVLRALLESSEDTSPDYPDLLKSPWGMGFDTKGTATDTHPDLKIDHLILGWNNESTPFSDLIQQLATAFGFTPSFKDGKLDFKRFGIPTVETTTQKVEVEPGKIHWDEGLARKSSRIEAKIEGLPWEDGRTLEVQPSDAASSGPDFSGQWASGETYSYEYPTLTPELGKSKSWQYVKAELVSRVKRSIEGRPSLEFSTTDESIELGDWIVIESLPIDPPEWVVGEDGKQREITSDSPLVGFVRERKLDPAGGARIEALIFFQDRAKKRAPSMYVEGWDGDARAYTPDEPLFGSFDDSGPIPDNQTFQEGMEVRVYDREMSFSAAVYEITDIGQDGTGDYIEVSSSFVNDPTDQYIRLADFDLYDPVETPRGFTFLADPSGFLSFPSEAEADTYGR